MKVFFFDDYHNDHFRFVLIDWDDELRNKLMYNYDAFSYIGNVERYGQLIWGPYIPVHKTMINNFLEDMMKAGFIFEPDSYINQVNPEDPEYINKILINISKSTNN